MITYEEWEQRFKPIKNPIELNAAYDGYMLETYGAEYELVQKAEQNKIWTLLDTDGDTYIVAGWHFVNRLGYFLTAVPWEPGQELNEDVAVLFKDLTEEEENLK